MTPDEAYAALKNHPDLPSPQGVAIEIMRLARSGHCSLVDLARVVETDPAISSRILRLVNSSAFPHPRPIVSLTEAIAYLGTRMVETVALGFSLITARGRCEAFDYVGFWSRSLARAITGCRIAQEFAPYPPDEVFTLGLLAELGQLVFAATHPDRYGTLIASLSCSEAEQAELEREWFGIDHDELTARLMQDWGFPTMICQAIGLRSRLEHGPVSFQEDPGRLAGVLALASELACRIARPSPEDEGLPRAVELACRLGMNSGNLAEVLEYAIPRWRELVSIFSVDELNAEQIRALCAEAAQLRAALS
ncbi:MAG TPA: HDOD domain-containing protein [Phycisphaerae bacterium]|nr:HDOD domain-containing protein [Phycisphaerae bacterium]HOJ73079.1 HDOD domain-containing protein [Phycisphaerae bacterium]HOM52695.1 HDOD domain-containing protein [Phycisphaerae bacterium]HON66045.1 HDOD domain-containing protein [Phycisphaerae bacterium]HOQ85050.1 HDOD domain-containing protein [Phycisphaerae bacterium]